MKFYLKYLNPIVSALILFLCLWAAVSGEHNKFDFWGIFGGFGTYFVAKGLFCSSVLFFSGKTLLYRLTEKPESLEIYSKRDSIIIGACIATCIGLFVTAFLTHASLLRDSSESDKSYIENPEGLIVGQLTTIKSSQFLMLTGRLINKTDYCWRSIDIVADINIGGVFSGRLSASDIELKAHESKNIVLQSKELLTSEIRDSVNLDTKISGVKISNSKQY